MAKLGRPNDRRKPRSAALYSSKIIKAGALISDTKTLFSVWDSTISLDSNIERIQHDNFFGKASRSRVKDILTIFRQRYLSKECTINALVHLVKHKFESSALERIFYFHAAQADLLLRHAITEILVPMHERGLNDVTSLDFQKKLADWVNEGKTCGEWSPATIKRISSGLLSTLRDFGVLIGSNHKRIAAHFLPIGAFAYIAFYLKQQHPSGSKLIDSPDWKLFFLSKESVERLLFEAHQLGMLEYHVAGSVSRLTFPAKTLEEYANVLAQR